MNQKLLFLLACLVAFPFFVNAQVGIGTETPHPSAQLEVAAESKGVLIPRVSADNRPAEPAEGLLIYQTDETPGFYYYDGTDWQRLGKPQGGGAIIPFTSGEPVSLIPFVYVDFENSRAAIGFGNSVSISRFGEETINQTSVAGYAFRLPRAGVITSISVDFTLSREISFNEQPNRIPITGQLYYASPSNNNLFFPISGANATPEPFNYSSPIGQTHSATAVGLNIPLEAGTRLLMVFSANMILEYPGFGLSPISGYASASVTID